MPWCPYTDRDLPGDATSPEHIIPLALGGSHQFCIPVEKNFNSEVGNRIDGVLSKDFLTSIRRCEFDARGHTNTPPEATLKKAILDGRPVQITLRGTEAPRVWDAKDERPLEESELAGKSFTGEIRLDWPSRFRFVAKVALSAGYEIFGELFREHVRHDELRVLMNFGDTGTFEWLEGTGLKGYHEFSPIEGKDEEFVEMERYLCETVKGSCVLCLVTTNSVIFTVGILGKWVGSLAVPATTDSFPMEGEFDLGHVVNIENKKVSRSSYRDHLRKAYSQLIAAP